MNESPVSARLLPLEKGEDERLPVNKALPKTMTRSSAFAIHLSISIAVFLAFLGVVFFLWYPAPYFAIHGSVDVLWIMAGVHVILGPFLLLILFKPDKPGLKFDIICVALMQASALLYGGMIIYQQRPEFVVFGIDRFTAVTAAEVEFDKLKYPELQRTAGIGPLLAQARPPEDLKLRQELLFGVLFEGKKDMEFRAELYEPYQPDLHQLRSHSIDLTQIATLSEDAKHAIDAFIAGQGGRLDDYLYLPLRGKNKDIVMTLSPEDGLPVGSIPISPWLEDYQVARP